MFRYINRLQSRRRGAILLLTAFLLIFLLGIIAFAVDIGYVLLAKTQLQTAADSAALAAAGTMGNSGDTATSTGIRFAGLNKVGNKNVVVQNSDVVYGSWDTTARAFTPTEAGLGNAVKVTARANDATSGAIPLFFGAVFGQHSVNSQASAVATCNPRDICFVVDLSGSMNDDTDPAKVSSIDASYPGVGTTMMQHIFDDFGFGTYPGTSQTAGAPLTSYKSGSPLTSYTATFAQFYDISAGSKSPLLHKKQPLTIGGVSYTVPAAYQVYQTGDGSGQAADTTTTATKKAYSWVIDEQLRGKSGSAAVPGLMKAAKPALDSTITNNYNYWQQYVSGNSTTLGYKSYLAAIEPKGRDVKPFSNSTLYSPLSVNSPDCPYHAESTDGGTFNFPPREMPTHSARRSIISAIQVVKERNQIIANTDQRDWVSIVSFELKTNVVVVHSLSGDYDAAMQKCPTMQACSDSASCTATETGLMLAMTHLNAVGRPHTNKVVVLLTDGKPNLYSSSNTTISNYRNAHTNSNFYGGSSDYPQDAAMMQASTMQSTNWLFFPIEIGLQGDSDFMNRIYSVGKGKKTQTDVSPYSATGDPTNYETELHNLFNQIISTPKVRIVQ